MGVRTWLLDNVFGDLLAERIAAAVPVKDGDESYYHNTTSPNYLARPWHEHRDLLEQIRNAVDTNPLAARIVGMTTEFTIGDAPQVTGDPWALRFWDHPQNQCSHRIYRWSDELSRAGELFIGLHPSPSDPDGMQYIREIPAHLVDEIATDPDDIERELQYHQLTNDVDGLWWDSPITAAENEPCVLHYAVNRPIGDLRGVSDLAQVVEWLERYDLWLEDRVRINRYKGAYLWHVSIENPLPGQIEAKKAQYTRPPTSGSIIVTDSTETWEAINPRIDANQVEADGKAIRLMIAAGAGIPLAYMAEGESATRSTAHEQATAAFRHFTHRQYILARVCSDIVQKAAQRAGRGVPTFEIIFEPVIAEADRDTSGVLPKENDPESAADHGQASTP